MQTHDASQGPVRRAVNDLVMVEMFLVQATIESAAAIGDGLSQLGREIARRDAAGPSRDPVSGALQRLAGAALEPYTSRFRYFRDMINAEH